MRAYEIYRAGTGEILELVLGADLTRAKRNRHYEKLNTPFNPCNVTRIGYRSITMSEYRKRMEEEKKVI